jgi:hypothetical protein
MIRAAVRAQLEADRRYPSRARTAVPPEELNGQLEIIHAWPDETCGTEGWATASAGTTGILNDAVALYFEDTAVAHTFVARFCCGLSGGDDSWSLCTPQRVPVVPRGAPDHKTP